MVAELIRRAQRKGWLRGRLVRFFLKRVRTLAGLREMPKFCLVLILAHMRETLWSVGKELAEAGRKDEGNILFDVLQQDGRPNHFTLVEAWRDRKAFDASVMASHTKDFRQKLTPLEGALYDERLYQAVR